MVRTACIGLVAGLALAASMAAAKVSEEEAARLGQELTPIGAERAGNAEGTIPEWTGGITEPPPGWKVGDPRIDPFRDDAKLFSIDRSNVDRYADKLSPGQLALIQQLEGHLHAQLLNRTTRRLSLTEGGAAFYQGCQRVVAEAEAAEQAVTHLAVAPGP